MVKSWTLTLEKLCYYHIMSSVILFSKDWEDLATALKMPYERGISNQGLSLNVDRSQKDASLSSSKDFKNLWPLSMICKRNVLPPSSNTKSKHLSLITINLTPPIRVLAWKQRRENWRCWRELQGAKQPPKEKGGCSAHKKSQRKLRSRSWTLLENCQRRHWKHTLPHGVRD